jgi:hypothetical protein
VKTLDHPEALNDPRKKKIILAPPGVSGIAIAGSTESPGMLDIRCKAFIRSIIKSDLL